MEDRHIAKSHNKTRLLYHIVCPVKYRREVLTDGVVKTLTETCLGIQSRYDIHFIEIGTDGDHPPARTRHPHSISPNTLCRPSRASRHELFSNRIQRSSGCCGGGEFWTKGYYVNTVGLYATEAIIRNYVKNQGKQYTKLHQGQSTLFDTPA